MNAVNGVANPLKTLHCTIAGVRCDLGYTDEATATYFRDYLDHGDGVQTGRGAQSPETPDIVVPYNAEGAVKVGRRYPDFSVPFIEMNLLYDPVSRAMLRFDRLTFHGACIEYGGRAYIFTAYSGTGKSTHIRLWGRYLGPSVRIVNGDKPIIDLHDVDDIAAYGSPWCGKEGWQRNVRVPLGGICILHRAQPSSAGESVTTGIGIGAALRNVAPGEAKPCDATSRNVASGDAVPGVATLRNAALSDVASCDVVPGSTASPRNTIRRATTDESIEDLINRIYLTDDPDQAAKATELLDRLITHVPVYVLTCDMSEDAVRTSFEGLTGEQYQRYEPQATPDTPESPAS